MTAIIALGMYASFAGWADAFGGSVLLLLFVALAAVFRYRAALWHRQRREIRNQEPVALARELHDTDRCACADVPVAERNPGHQRPEAVLLAHTVVMA